MLREQRTAYTELLATTMKLLYSEDALGAPDIDPLADDDSVPHHQPAFRAPGLTGTSCH